MREIIIFLSCFSSFLFAQSVQTSCVFYVGADNKLTCLGIKSPDPKKFTTTNGYVDDNPYYRPKEAGIARLEYNKKVYVVEVKNLPDPLILLEGHLKDSFVIRKELQDGTSVIPYMPDIPFDVYISIKQVQYSLLNRMKKPKVTKLVSGNQLKIDQSSIVGAIYLQIDYAMIVVSGLAPQKINCKTLIKIS